MFINYTELKEFRNKILIKLIKKDDNDIHDLEKIHRHLPSI